MALFRGFPAGLQLFGVIMTVTAVVMTTVQGFLGAPMVIPTVTGMISPIFDKVRTR